jgi:four helix bundle protein
MSEYPVEDDVVLVAEPDGNVIRRHQQLEVYSIAFKAAARVFSISKEFPGEERYSLTDQIRRSSRSVCANIAEAWRRRRYEAAFQNSLNHAEAEAAETQTWISFALECGYMTSNEADELTRTYDVLIGKLVYMITHPKPWILPLKGK